MATSMVYQITQEVQVNFRYPVIFTESAFSVNNKVMADLLTANSKVLVVIDANVSKSHPELLTELKSYALAHQINLVRPALQLPGGELIKKDISHLKTIYQLVADEQIDRHSYILAIGGGALLDAVGFAAATAHRGVRLLRMPTTVLAQNDAGVGVKTGVNYLDRKNYLGVFAPPYAVVNDFSLLSTLSVRDRRSGIAEAVKVALIKDAEFFLQLNEQRHALARFEPAAMQQMIIRCAELHLDHIQNSGDPFEMGSARPLDFGHWSAHKLEALSAYSLRHGEAVAIGIALDTLYSCQMGMIEQRECDQVLNLLSALGFELSSALLLTLDVQGALDEFREHLGGLLCITLLNGLGQARQVNQIDVDVMSDCVHKLQECESVRKPA